MRQNLPVTNREHDFPTDATLMSTTDAQSHITYANDAFVSVSGFSREEIQGSPHNIVRHPDMPPQRPSEICGRPSSRASRGRRW